MAEFQFTERQKDRILNVLLVLSLSLLASGTVWSHNPKKADNPPTSSYSNITLTPLVVKQLPEYSLLEVAASESASGSTGSTAATATSSTPSSTAGTGAASAAQAPKLTDSVPSAPSPLTPIVNTLSLIVRTVTGVL